MKDKKRKLCIISIVIILLIIIDQIIKIFITNNLKNENVIIIENFLKLNYTENTGIAFGMQSNNLISIIITNTIIIAIIVRFLIKQFHNMNASTKIAISMIIAGGLSNLIDRIVRGKVIDYIDVSSFINFPIFNIADCFVVIGFIIFVINVGIEIFGSRLKKVGDDELDKENNS